MADVRAIRCRCQRESYPRFQHQQVQRLWLRHHVKLRGGCHGDPQPERVPSGGQSPAGIIQDQQGTQVELREKGRGGGEKEVKYVLFFFFFVDVS